MIELHQIEIKHLREKGETVLFRRVDPQPERCEKYGRPGYEWFVKFVGVMWDDTVEYAVPTEYCPLGKTGNTVTTADGLTLRIVSVGVQELRPMLGGGSVEWYWGVGVEVAE